MRCVLHSPPRFDSRMRHSSYAAEHCLRHGVDPGWSHETKKHPRVAKKPRSWGAGRAAASLGSTGAAAGGATAWLCALGAAVVGRTAGIGTYAGVASTGAGAAAPSTRAARFGRAVGSGAGTIYGGVP